MTAFSKRPANLFFDAVFLQSSVKGNQIKETLPGSRDLFSFRGRSHSEIRKFLQEINPTDIVSFSARDKDGFVQKESKRIHLKLDELFGKEQYKMSYKEITDSLDSQRIYLSPCLPKKFYIDLKSAMRMDKIVTLPGDDRNPTLLRNLPSTYVAALLLEVKTRWADCGFESRAKLEDLLNLTIYQIGSMVIKREDYHVFVDEHGQILSRESGESDALRLINGCGIRGIKSNQHDNAINTAIMQSTFKAALIAAESGQVVFPAVGMGVWRGPPEIYWTALLNAIIQSASPLEKIYICPGHQKTASGQYIGRSGDEFQEFLDQFKRDYPENPNLAKVVNLFDKQTDMIHLARKLKAEHPDTTISIFNASDPDVTLGYHVGEYVNNLPHCAPTTEENLTAIGTNGLCFEGITGIHEDPSRIIATP